jgi:predicted AAA+ superfamily ATPase
MEFVRKKYINILNDHINDQNIKVITGIRRIGKSTILNQFINFLLNDLKIMNTQIQKYDFNNPFLVKKTYPKVYQEILKKAIKNETNYLFFDEIQEIKNFERLIIGLYENKDFDFDIYITGSNSHMFSSELVTLFTGRTFELEIFPFSFIEVCEFLLNNNSH